MTVWGTQAWECRGKEYKMVIRGPKEGRKSRKEESRSMVWEGTMSQGITVWMGGKIERGETGLVR